MSRALAIRVSAVLRQIARGEITPVLTGADAGGKPYTCWEDTWCGEPTFQCGAWQIRVFNDCGEWDYVDGGTTPEGTTFEYEDVNFLSGIGEDDEPGYFPEGALSHEDPNLMLAAFYSAVPKEENVKDEVKEPQQPTPAPPEKPVPGPNDKVMKIWRDEKGQVWVDDDDMGAANAFNLVHWAQMICWSPFLSRQITAELSQVGFFTGRMIHEHELRMHGATGPGSDLVSPGGKSLTSASTPSVLGGGGRDEVRHSRQSGESKEATGPTHEAEPTGDTLQSPPKR